MMKKPVFAILFFSATAVAGQPNHIVISQVYGGGGNSGALFTHDFVELFNPTTATVSLDGLSLQYSGATTATWSSNKVLLTGSVGPGQYFLVQLNSGGTAGGPLPAPDLVSNQIILNAGSGKLAVVKGTETISGNCPTGELVDFVGYGGADCSETAVAPGTANHSSLQRINNGCSDNNNNATDFLVSIPDPRNRSAHLHTCQGQQINISSMPPGPFCIDSTTGAAGSLSFAATGNFMGAPLQLVLSDVRGTFTSPLLIGSAAIDGADPRGNLAFSIPKGLSSGTAYRLRLQTDDPALTGDPAMREIINGAKNADQLKAAPADGQLWLTWSSPSGCFDELMIVVKEGSLITAVPRGDGSAYVADPDLNGTGTPFDGGKVVYKGSVSGQLVSGLTNGKTYHIKIFTRRGIWWSTGMATAEIPRLVPLPGEVVINQISPDYNTAQDEYIELVNLTGKSFDLSDLALRFTNADGRNVVAGGTLSGILPPHSFWLLSPNTTITVGRTIAMAPDQIIDGGFAAQNQQVGLLRKTDNVIIDAVAYGTVNIPVYLEAAPAVNPSVDGGLKRLIDGKDGNQNGQDFVRVAQQHIELRNSRDRLAVKSALIPAGTYRTVKVTGNAGLAGAVTVTERLILESGKLAIGDQGLLTDSVSGGSATAYVVTNGSGMLAIRQVSATLFPVGDATYNPVTISGENKGWQVRVTDGLPSGAPFLAAAAVQRTWEVRPLSEPASGATLVFEYDDADPVQVGSAFNRSAAVDIWVYRQVWNREVAAQVPAVVSGGKSVTLPGWQEAAFISIADDARPLPVKFAAFRAIAQAASIDLAFSNEAESNVLQYVVERSPNGKDFFPLIALSPVANHGGAASYRTSDKQPYPGYNFYRVRGIEKNGNSYYTQIIRSSMIRSGRVLSVLPNIVRGGVLRWEASFPKGRWQVVILNPAGQEMVLETIQHRGGYAHHTMAIPPGAPPGVYILQLRNNEKQLQQRFVIQ